VCSMVTEEVPHMLAQPAILLSIAPLYSPFPVALALSTVATAAFSIELVLARLRVRPRIWTYVLLASCIALGAMLMAWSGYKPSHKYSYSLPKPHEKPAQKGPNLFMSWLV
jgi:hypothetical protein